MPSPRRILSLAGALVALHVAPLRAQSLATSAAGVTLLSERAADTTQMRPPRMHLSPECGSWRTWGSVIGGTVAVIEDIRLIRSARDGYAGLALIVASPVLVALPFAGAFVGAGAGEVACRLVTHE